MIVRIELWHLITLAAALWGGYYALVKVIVIQFNKNLDERFKGQEEARTNAQSEWTRRFSNVDDGLKSLERRFNDHLVDLPNKYQRREDAIRQEVNIISRLDGLAGLVEERFQQMDTKIERRRA